MIVLATLAPLCFAGWLVWQSVRGDGEGGGDTSARRGSVSGGPGGDAGPSGDSGQREPRDPGERLEEQPGDGATRGGEKGKKNAAGPLRGTTVVIDPGHNPNNHDHPEEINRLVNIGTNEKACDTTGTATDSGYPEADFTLDLARRVREALEKQGARVTLTQEGDRAYGPCVDERAAIGNDAHADAAVSLHADGSGAGNRGFHVILPAALRAGKADTTAIARPSRLLGTALAASFRAATGARPAAYIGAEDGLVTRRDLGGLNLSTVPKVFLECGNMRDAQDAARLTDPKWRARAADGISEGVSAFLNGRH